MRRSTLAVLSPSQLNSQTRPPRAGDLRSSLPGPAGRNDGRKSLSHRASMHGRGGSQTRADPRHIADKNFQVKCIKNLMNYLTTHGYTSTISQKLLGSPSAKDITGIIQFLFQQVDSNLKVVKIEEDVPAVFKRLGYPFQINKSALYAAGSPQTWPGLLAALAWLVNLLVYEEYANESDHPAQEEGVAGGAEPIFGGGDNESLAFFDKAAQTYYLYMEGMDDELKEVEAAAKLEYVQEIDTVAQETESLEAEYLECEEKLQQLNEESNSLDALRAQKAGLAEDIEKLCEMVNRYQDHAAACAKKVEEKKADLATKQAEKANVDMENATLKEKVNAQQANTKEYNRLTRESQLRAEELHSLHSQAEELTKMEWDLEVQASRKMKDVEAAVGSFNELARRSRFSIVDSDVQLTLDINPRADEPNEVIVQDIKATVMPRITELMSLSQKNMAAKLEERQILQNKVSECTKATGELADMLATLTSQNTKLQARCKEPKEKVEAAEIKEAKEKEQMFQAIDHETRIIQSTDLRMRKQVTDHNVKVRAMNEEIQRDVDNRYQIVELAMSHKEYVSAALRDFLGTANRVVEDLEQASMWRKILNN